MTVAKVLHIIQRRIFFYLFFHLQEICDDRGCKYRGIMLTFIKVVTEREYIYFHAELTAMRENIYTHAPDSKCVKMYKIEGWKR